MLPVHFPSVHQTQIYLMNQIGALHALARTLVLQKMGSHTAQFAIDQRGQSLQGLESPSAQARRSSVVSAALDEFGMVPVLESIEYVRLIGGVANMTPDRWRRSPE